MEREEIYFVLFEQQKDFEEIKNLVGRRIVNKISKIIPLKMPLVITGVRRCGKSSLLRILKDKLELEEKQFLYINFNDERLVNFEINDYQKINDYLEEHNYKKDSVFFIDEIQEVEKWEKWIDRIRNNHQIFITGSNSKLLSKEISSILTGRSISISLYPFSFLEYLDTRGIDLRDWKIDKKLQIRLRAEFKRFMEEGGFPQRVIDGQNIIVKELYENILYRDIIQRFNKNLIKPIKEISVYLLSNTGSDLSLRTLSKISGIKNLSNVKQVMDAFENAFLFFTTNKFDYSIKKQLQNPKKIYCIDNGFPTSLGFRFSEDKGKLLENLVAIELKRREKEIYYHKEKSECDFLIKDRLKIIEAIQVCYNLNEKNKKREIEGLKEAMNKFNLKRGVILTFNQEDEINFNGKKIILRPVWKWMLEEE